MNDQDWGAWSTEAVSMMNSRNRAWIERYQLTGASYVWDLNSATIAFDGASTRVVADLCLVGTASKAEGSFLWAWANDDIPAGAKRDLEKVRAFGEEFDLGLLVTPSQDGGRAEGLEALAIAGRVLDADGVWVDERGDLTLFFALFNFRRGHD
ncbi:MAG TPA: hypothetical protein VJT13_22420 [Xanthobacteraceae bacterium]|nr:hypothetical protein [Xanthobacteraceae bacterium]